MSPRARRAPTLAIASAVAAIVAALAVAQYLSGRPPICTCGRVALWTGDVNGPANSQMLADWYSLSHVVHGLILYAALAWIAPRLPVTVRLWIATAIEATWELIENAPATIERYRHATIALGYSGDSIVNSVSDVAMMMLGFALARTLPCRASLALALTAELIALAAIRDNLTLNVLMLLHPIEAIRIWQAAA